ncbi:hypothetical protein EKH79_09155 [Dyella dinghuensis]|uniref:Uncharacterized protein n=2 Tax=Dyella dinghuensis TaxID=1920169 RepID=A0A432LVD3_9GAMM|nr:hypothetical protein EKH79_09155 [Dyella dinghuensis]
MSVNNPYDAPKSSVEDVVEHSAALEQVAGGQKLIIYSILLYFVGMAMNRSFAGGLTLVCVLASLALSITGIIRLCNGMGYSTLNKVFLIISLFLPLVNLIVLVSLSIRATSRLKEAGYKVGLLGARR